MSVERSGDTSPGNGAGTHHISSVAHHFLAESPVDSDASAVAVRRLIVGAATEPRAAAFAAAGLLSALDSGGWKRSSPPDRSGRISSLTLFEASCAERSATAYLAESHLLPLESPDVPEGLPAGWADTAWQVGPESDSRSDGERGDRFHVFQMGTMSENLLEYFELRRVVRADGARPGLVWCLRRDEARALTKAQVLGRLLAALDPDPIEILVFPEGWPSDERGGLLDRVRRLAGHRKGEAPRLVAEVEDLFRCLLPRGAVTVSQLDVAESGKLAAGSTAVFEAAARRLAAPTPPA